MIRKGMLIMLLALLVSCDKEGDLFSEPKAKDLGVDFVNLLTPTKDMNILDYLYFYNGGGVAVGDINNDGMPDIYFSGNQVKNRLYLNKGNLKFEEVTTTAGVSGNSDWNTAAIMGDVNGDGLLDIYVCAVVGLNGLNGHNELFINNGPDSTGNITFTEAAAAYGLDARSFSSSAGFLDYDGDGDLDLYLLNHAVHTQNSFGRASLREKRNYQTGDKLFRNDGKGKKGQIHFTDVSEEAGIYGGVNSYGLGLAIADFNQDGFPDIYVGNDFHEDDYYYLNNGDGSFRESLRENFGHTSRFSMGSDAADLNHDGWPDLISLDMLPEEEVALKSTEGDDNIQTQKLRVERYGYHYQFTRNMLFINQPGHGFRESAIASGIAATDWSWSALFADYDQDGEQDVFISNGITKRPNDLDYIKFVSSEQIQSKMSNTKLIDQKALRLMPSGATHNCVFKGDGDLGFIDESARWIKDDTLVSGATAYADLDGDGDLDLVANNLNAPPSFYINKTNKKANYLKVRLKQEGANPFATGAKVYAYVNGTLNYRELYTTRGFQASSEPLIHFGLGQARTVDSLHIIWPDRRMQKLYKVAANQTLSLSRKNTRPFDYTSLRPKENKLFTKIEGDLGIDFTHREDGYLDFNRQKLIPYRIGDRGPATAVGDLNGDGKDDVFFGGSKFIPSQVFLQGDLLFYKKEYPVLSKDSITEDVVALIADFENTGKNALIIGTGGGDFSENSKALLDPYYARKDTAFAKKDFPELYENAGALAAYDYDGDGDLDLFVGNQALTGDFGAIPKSYLLKNTNGNFAMDKENNLDAIGMVTDAVWDDFDGDGLKDLIVVGEWMTPRFFNNKKGKLTEVRLLDGQKLKGLWQKIQVFDMDGDGDMDYLLGNWGQNSKFKATTGFPLRMYYGDLDKNGQTETIIATAKNNIYYPIMGLDALAGQLVKLKKEYTSYKDFAGKDMEQLFSEDVLKSSKLLEAETLKSGYLRNDNGKFKFFPFPEFMQIAPIMAFCAHDFDGDGTLDVLAAGNYFGTTPMHGRMDSFPGALIKSEKEMVPAYTLGLDFAQKSARDLRVIQVNGRDYLLVTFNNERVGVYGMIK